MQQTPTQNFRACGFPDGDEFSAMQSDFVDDSASQSDFVDFRKSAAGYGFFLCLRGHAGLMSGEQSYSLAPGDLCVFAPNIGVHVAWRSPDLEGVADEDSVEVFYGVVSRIPVRKRIMMRKNPVVRISETDAREIEALCRLAGRAPVAEDSGGDFAAKIGASYREHLRQTICLKVCHAYFAGARCEEEPESRGEAVFNSFLLALYAEYNVHRTVSYYAARQHLSVFHFARIIREQSGRMASEWISDVTMIFARKYLENPELSIKEVCRMTGFRDQSSFSRYFRHRQGESPTDYRNRLNHKI